MTMDAVDEILQICRTIRREADNLPDQAPGMNRVVASLLMAASQYIIGREDPDPAMERLDDAVREIRIRTLRGLDGNPEKRGAHWAGKTAAEMYFSWRSPEIPRGMMPEKTPCGRWYI